MRGRRWLVGRGGGGGHSDGKDDYWGWFGGGVKGKVGGSEDSWGKQKEIVTLSTRQALTNNTFFGLFYFCPSHKVFCKSLNSVALQDMNLKVLCPPPKNI